MLKRRGACVYVRFRVSVPLPGGLTNLAPHPPQHIVHAYPPLLLHVCTRVRARALACTTRKRVLA